MKTICFIAFILAQSFYCEVVAVQTVILKNAARDGTEMPIVGIGTWGYVHTPGTGIPGEVWNDTTAESAIKEWLKIGGRRIDNAHDYFDQKGIGKAIKESGVSRKDIFLVSKIDALALGYNSTLKQINNILSGLQVDYVDLLLIHWPGPPSPFSRDPACQGIPSTWRACRQSTWKAMEAIYNANKTRAIGVSNFEQNHLEDIISMGGMIPAVNQIEYSIYWHEDDLVEACKSKNILVNGYSPLGAVDWAPTNHHWNNSQLEDPLVKQIAKKYKRTPAQVILRWEWQNGVVVNPRSMNVTHMKENLSIFDFKLTEEEMKSLADPPSKPTNPKVCPDPNKIK